MKKTYQIGLDVNEIFIYVEFGTVGIANTIVQLSKPDGEYANIAQSTVNSGHIPKKRVGTAKDIRGNVLSIRTIVDLHTIFPDRRDNALENMSASYRISGGLSGEVGFGFDADDKTVSADGCVVVIEKVVDLQ